MPISGGIAGGGGGGYLALTSTNRIIGSNAGAGNASNVVIFIGANAGAANAGTRNIGIGVDASRNAFSTDVLVIGNNNPTRIGEKGANTGAILIGNSILTNFAPGAVNDLVNCTLIGNSVASVMSPNAGNDFANCVFIGYRAGRGLASGSIPVFGPGVYQTVVIGNDAALSVNNRMGLRDSVIIGSGAAGGTSFSAVATNDTGAYIGSVVIGRSAAEVLSMQDSVAIGQDALGGNTPGYVFNCVAIGNSSLGTSETGGNRNTALGYSSGVGISSGADNVLIGYQSDLVGVSNRNITVGVSSGAPTSASTDSVFIGNLAGRNLAAGPTSKFYLESLPSVLNGGATPFLFGDLQFGNLVLGNREDATGATSRGFGTGAVNNFKIQEGTVPTTAPNNGASLFVQNTAGVYSLRVIGPGGVAQILATGL